MGLVEGTGVDFGGGEEIETFFLGGGGGVDGGEEGVEGLGKVGFDGEEGCFCCWG